MPKAFLSYSWSSPSIRGLIREWAERLSTDGVEVVLDQIDLKEGDDKYAFMERMVADSSVTHVLVFSDSSYARKADERTAGVGTESQIISREIYEKVEQSKFIPIVCEFSEGGEPCLPIFMKSRIWISFATPEAVNEHWEQLIRRIFGKPLFERPALGKPPSYITDVGTAAPAASGPTAKFRSLENAVINGRPTVPRLRQDFLQSCYAFCDDLRERAGRKPAEQVYADFKAMSAIRDLIVEWVLLEGNGPTEAGWAQALMDWLERLVQLRARPPEVTSWNDRWFEAHQLFAHELFLYVVAALLKVEQYQILREVYTTHYLLPETEQQGEIMFDTFDVFYCHATSVAQFVTPEGQRLLSPTGAVFKTNATRSDIPFSSIIDADIVTFFMAMLGKDTRWYPVTAFYAEYFRPRTLFVRAARHKDFQKLVLLTGIGTAEELRNAARAGYERMGVAKWSDFQIYLRGSIWNALNVEKLDTID